MATHVTTSITSNIFIPGTPGANGREDHLEGTEFVRSEEALFSYSYHYMQVNPLD
jgi:hypothetical protein